jgi:hypothetical protein
MPGAGRAKQRQAYAMCLLLLTCPGFLLLLLRYAVCVLARD